MRIVTGSLADETPPRSTVDVGDNRLDYIVVGYPIATPLQVSGQCGMRVVVVVVTDSVVLVATRSDVVDASEGAFEVATVSTPAHDNTTDATTEKTEGLL